MARLYETAQPDVVIHLAAEVGGIGANIAHPGRFFFATMAMGLQLVEHARRCDIEKFVHTGTGAATREFLYVDDAAEGVVRAAEVIDEPLPINLSGGVEISIRDLATRIVAACGFQRRIDWDSTKPDGQRRRSLDISRAEKLLGWRPRQHFNEGLAATVKWWRERG